MDLSKEFNARQGDLQKGCSNPHKGQQRLQITRRVLLLFLLAASVSLWGGQAQALTLDQCLQLSEQHNPQLRAYSLAVDEADKGINEAWGAFLPTVSLSYTTTELQNAAKKETDSDYLDQQSDSFSCRLTQPLFTGLSGVTGLRRARDLHQYRQIELGHLRQQVREGVKKSFYQLLHQKALVLLWQDSVQRLVKQQQIAEAWVEQRLAPRLRLLEINVELANARQNLSQATVQTEVAKAYLQQWLGGNLDVPTDAQGALEGPLPSLLPLQNYIDKALQDRSEIKLGELSVQLADHDAKQILARNLPQAQLEASWVDYQRDYDKADYTDQDRDYYSVTLNLTMRPFQGGRNLSAWQKQRLAVKRTEYQLAQARNQITSEVTAAYYQVVEATERIGNTAQTFIAAQEAYQLASKSASVGVVALDALLDAELRLTRAEIDVSEAWFSLRSAQAAFDTAIAEQVLSADFAEQ